MHHPVESGESLELKQCIASVNCADTFLKPDCGIPAAAAAVCCNLCAGQTCFRTAIKAGFTGVQILNHIDHDQGAWRNELDMNPLAQYEGFTYEDVVVRPAADALRTVTRPSTKVGGFDRMLSR